MSLSGPCHRALTAKLGKKKRSQAGGYQGPAIIPPKAFRILVRICSQVQSALLVACVRSLGGRRGGTQKQATHQKTKEKLSSATPNRDKTIHCQRKRRKKHPANNVAAESAPHPRHAAKACDNNTQTIPNNMVLWQRWATCRRGQRPSISNRVPRDLAILLDLQKHCGSLKPRQFWQKRSLQQSHFRGRKQISFLDSQRGAPSVALKLAAQTKPNFDPLASCEELRISSSSRFQLSKMGLPSATAFHFGQGHSEAVFNLDFNSRRDQKRARQIHTLERVATLFLGLRHDARNAPSCFKSSPETMKPQKGRRMTQTSMC